MSTLNHALGKTIRRLRADMNLSQEEFAHRAGLHRTYISQLERGIKSPTLDVVYKLCDVITLRMSEFIKEVEKEIE